MIWTVYIIESNDGKLYTGITTDITRRLHQHQTKKGARFFHFSGAKQILFQESYPNRSLATQKELQIKKMKREEKLTLIKNSSLSISS